MKDYLETYFKDSEQYPEPTARTDLLPLGTLYEYLSSTFLNGWINYVRIESAFLITRYRRHAKNVEDAQAFNQKREVHADFGKQLQDDVFILARSMPDRLTGEAPNHWWFFWYDRDCSDCEIGRFESDDPPETIVKAFAEFAENRSQDLSKSYANGWNACDRPDDDTSGNAAGCPAIKLDPRAFRGWISG